MKRRNLYKFFTFALATALSLGLLLTPAAAQEGGEITEPHAGYLVVLREQPVSGLSLLGEPVEIDLAPVVESARLYHADTMEETAPYVYAGMVEGIYPNYLVELCALPNDPYYTDTGVNRQWYLDAIDMPYLWNNRPEVTGAGVRVAVIDSGINAAHPDFQRSGGSCVEDGRNYAGDGLTSLDDIAGHGTRVAGIIAATTNNGIGIAGIAPGATIVSLKAFYVTEGGGSTADVGTVIQAIYDAVDVFDCQVINMSFRFLTTDDAPHAPLTAAVEHAASKGALLVAAAGNDGGDATIGGTGIEARYRPSYPAADAIVLSVGSSDATGKVADGSQRHPSTGVCAPGVDITSTASSLAYSKQGGTSFAAPQVAAAAALAKQLDPSLTQAGFMALVTQSAAPLPAGDPNRQYGGAGILSIAGLLQPQSLIELPTAETEGWRVDAYFWAIAPGAARLVAAGYDEHNRLIESYTSAVMVPPGGALPCGATFTNDAVRTVRFFLQGGVTFAPAAPPAESILPPG